MKHLAEVVRKSEREYVVTRTIKGPARLAFEAWTHADQFKKWWVPQSCGLTLLSCEMDVRVGGRYRLVFFHQGTEMAFFGAYREVKPNSRLVWTNEESDGGETISSVTFNEGDGMTTLVVHDLYPSKEALDVAIES